MWFDEPAPAFEREMAPALKLTAAGSALLMFPVLLFFMGALREAAERAAAVLF